MPINDYSTESQPTPGLLGSWANMINRIPGTPDYPVLGVGAPEVPLLEVECNALVNGGVKSVHLFLTKEEAEALGVRAIQHAGVLPLM